MPNNAVVNRDCKVSVPVYGEQAFANGATVSYYSPYYAVLMASGFATDNGVAAIPPAAPPSTQPMSLYSDVRPNGGTVVWSSARGAFIFGTPDALVGIMLMGQM